MNFADILGSPAVTLGSVTIGTIIIALTVQRWWKKGSGGGGKGEGGGRSWKALVPFVLSLAYGLLAVLAASGDSLLGILTNFGLWGGNQLGYAYLVWGVGGNSPGVTRASHVVLSDGGYAVYGIWTAMIVGQHLWGKRLPRLQNIFGAIAGILLGLSQGIAGIAAIPLASAINAIGAWYTGVVQ